MKVVYVLLSAKWFQTVFQTSIHKCATQGRGNDPPNKDKPKHGLFFQNNGRTKTETRKLAKNPASRGEAQFLHTTEDRHSDLSGNSPVVDHLLSIRSKSV